MDVPAESGATRLVELRRVLAAPPRDVFAAWTNPELMRRWMSPVGHAEAEVDLRVGGAFRVVMVGEGTTIEHTGRYLEISPPRLLVFTWASPYTGSQTTVVRVVLRRAGDGTEIHLTHEGLTPEAAQSHRGGWIRMLDGLALSLEGRRET